MSIYREAISDDKGQADMAYLVIGWLALAAVITLAFICSMSAVSFHGCAPDITIGADQERHIKSCVFDPLPIGQACGLVFAAFATLIGALSAYMLATRRSSGVQQTSAITQTTTAVQSETKG